MYYVYILKSLSSNHFYTGQTNDLEKRLVYHNSGRVGWSSRHRPWEIFYHEQFNFRDEAVKREKYFKSHAGRNWLKKNFETN